MGTPTPIAGQLLGHYRIVERIGAGGMGVVYRAHDERLDRDVALKVLPPGTLGDDLARLRFRQEALALSRLNHPYIETVHDFDTYEGLDFLVMELIAGESLDAKLKAGPLSELEVCRLGEQLAEALAAAHERGVVHRDLKPGNMRITPEGRLKILDFGIAKLLHLDAGTTLPGDATALAEPLSTSDQVTQTIAFVTQGAVGTLPYMSPEQLSGSQVDPRTDIYSAGVVLYEMCCGRHPFPQRDPDELVTAIMNQPPNTTGVRISPKLARIVFRTLEKDPRNRYQSAQEMLADLRALTLSLAKQPRPSKIIDSIAVLPFEDAGHNPETEYVSDGITESLILALSGLPKLKKVIARSSVFRYKGRQVPPQEVGRELDVRAVLTGRVIQRGDTISVSAELVDTLDSRHLWGEQYERNLAMVADIQNEISRNIAEKLKLKLAAGKRKPREETHPATAEAYRLYLKGRYYWNKRPGQRMVQKALAHFEQATKEHADFAPAYVGLADCYNSLGRWEDGAMAPQIAFPLAKAAASRALLLDGALAEAHSALAYASMHFDWDWSAAGKGFRRALELNPNSSHAHHWYAHYLMAMGRTEEAMSESLRILELDPLDLVINVHMAWHYYLAHQFAEAVDASKKTLEMEPYFHWGHFFLGWAYEQLKMFPQAIEVLQKSVLLSGGSTLMKAALGHAYGVAGDSSSALKVIGELTELSKTRYVSSYEIGLIHVAVGDIDNAFTWLDKAVEERSGWFPYLNVEPRLDHLRSDPRLENLLRRVGLTRPEGRYRATG